MPDLTIEYHWSCSNALDYRTTINGHRVEYTSYNGKWHCDCKGFQFRHTCKHVTEAIEKKCGWSEFHSEQTAKIVQKTDEYPHGLACPCCGAPVTSIGFGV